jgi:DUF4097 and DUF4098 domain-containing protein YvlB
MSSRAADAVAHGRLRQLRLPAAALIAALAASGAFEAGARAQDQGPLRRSPQTDQTVAVARGGRLSIDNFAGEVIVRTWDRDSLRVQARHAARVRVNVRTIPTGIRLSASAERGPVGSVDYEVTAPEWMPIKIDGQFNFVTIEGTQAEVAVETVRGDITVKGGNGVIAKSIEGEVLVEDARGKINISSVNQGVAINGASGEIIAETVNGPIKLSRIEASSVEAGTINGDITYEGAAATAGRYRFTSHNGNILVSVPESANATFSVRTYNGSFNSNLPVKGEGNTRSGRRVTFTLGTGSAEFELESFSGNIRLRRPGTVPASKAK